MESTLLSRRSQEIIKGKMYIVLNMYLTCTNLFNSVILPSMYYYYPHYVQEDERREGEDLKKAVKVTVNEW